MIYIDQPLSGIALDRTNGILRKYGRLPVEEGATIQAALHRLGVMRLSELCDAIGDLHLALQAAYGDGKTTTGYEYVALLDAALEHEEEPIEAEKKACFFEGGKSPTDSQKKACFFENPADVWPSLEHLPEGRDLFAEWPIAGLDETE